MKAYKSFSTLVTPQSEPIPGKTQVENSAGGFVYTLDPWKQFERFLVLGSEGGTYYVSEKALTKESALNTISCINADGRRAVDLIVDVSHRGRAPKNDPALFALALAASAASPETRSYALARLSEVARIPTHLFHFVTYARQFRGLGRGLRRALGDWYNEKPVDQLAYQCVKYQSRDGWSNADVLRLSHPKTTDVHRNFVYRWIVDGFEEAKAKSPDYSIHIPQIIPAFEAAKTQPIENLPSQIRAYGLTREMLPTEALTSPEVWEALLEKMPLEAMIRNLGVMSKVGLLKPMSAAAQVITARLRSEELLHKARIHPIKVLIALKTYASGHGVKGKGEWTPVPSVVDALDDAFYLAFKNVEPTGKRLLFGVDVSGSMSSPCGGLPISCAEGAAAMALACAKTEKEFFVMGFTAGSGYGLSRYGMGRQGSIDGFVDLGITPKMRLDDALKKTAGLNFGSTDCAIPMLWAEKQKVTVDCFIVITDSETWAGSIHPSQALKQYRQKMGVPAKQVVIGMTATEFTIADPRDPLTLDVVGFDTATPEVIQEFVR
jgi:60 kDa SS-A/Ro ribonucleoprotein